MADEKPQTLKLDMMELTVLESVETALRERGGTTAEPQAEPGYPNFAMINQLEPAALSGYLPCE